jgi:small redox-active disulfide protein 2
MSMAKSIEILGPGCARCKETYRVIREAVEQAGLDCEVTKNESIERMVELGLMSTPGVAVDGQVVLAGRVPRVGEVRQLLGIE